jgi:probable DNA metabolism protein
VRGTATTITLPRPDDYDAWRDAARGLLAHGIRPEDVAWRVAGDAADLFAAPEAAPVPDAPPIRVSRAFVDLADAAIRHRDPERFALLYALLWRLRERPGLAKDAADPLVRRIAMLAKAVRRDIHKMRAFVRFRSVGEGAGERFVAWFEPEHHIVRANAGFFVRRFATMHWSILTPEVAIHWDGETLTEGPGASAADAPEGDPLEDAWRTYYASTFNPARLKIGAMLREMPKKYWKNMPETALVPGLIAGAQARESAMIAASASQAE